MDEGLRDWVLLIGKSLLFAMGGLLVVAALVDLVVGPPRWLAVGVLLLGLAMAVPPLALAFRDAVREAKKGRL